MTFTSISDALNSAAGAAGTSVSRVPHGAASYAYSVGAEAAARAAATGVIAGRQAQSARSASAADGAAVANAVLGWVSSCFSFSNRPLYMETELTKKATDLRHEALEKRNSPLLHEKIDALVIALRSGNKNEFASQLEAEKASLIAKRAEVEVEQKVVYDPQRATAVVLNVPASANRGSDPLKLTYEDVEAIHHLCLSIIQNELPQEVRSSLLRIKTEVETGYDFKYMIVKAEIDKLGEIYSGSLLDLPFPGSWKIEFLDRDCLGDILGQLGFREKRFDTGDPSKPQSSLWEFFQQFEFNELNPCLRSWQKELIECLLNNQNSLSDFHQKHLIASIFSIIWDRFRLDDKLATSKIALDKGADPAVLEAFWRTRKFIDELFDSERGFYYTGLLEMACLQGWDMRCDPLLNPRSENSSSIDENLKDSTLLRTMREHYGLEWRSKFNGSYHRFRLHPFLETAIDFGADPLDVMDQATIDRIQQSIGQKNSICSCGATHGIHYTRDGYALTENFHYWEFEFIQRWNRGLYRKVKQQVTAQYIKQMDRVINGEGRVDLSVAAAGGAERIGAYGWPRELSQLVLDYSGLSRAIALEVQKKRKTLT